MNIVEPIPIYEERIVAFIDILGFKEKINLSIINDKENVDETNRINSFFNELYWHFDIKGEASKALGAKPNLKTKISQFSDSIVISFKFNEKGQVYDLLLKLLYLHEYAIKYNLLIRGAIAYGMLFHKDGRLFGPALNEAYFMESQKAIYPRIILSPKIIEIGCFNGYITCTPEEEKKYINKLIDEDNDGYYYIDYFNAIKTIIFEETYEFKSYVQDLKKIIDEGYSKNNPKINEKMDWMLKKYSEVINEIRSTPTN